MGITDYMGPLPKGQSRQERFLRRAKQLSSKEGQRELEQTMLPPEKLPPYTGEKPGVGPVEARTVTFIFESEADVELLSKHIRVSKYQGLNTRDTALFIALLDALDNNSLHWDKDTATLSVVDDRDERTPL